MADSFSRRILILFFCTGIFYSCSEINSAPYKPEEESETESAEGDWEDVLSNDSKYPQNVYLTKLVEFHPGQAGSARWSDNEHYDENGYPYSNEGALGPPEGSYPSSLSNSNAEMTVLGSGGWAVWRFNPDFRIIDDEGSDFVTFSNHNVLNGNPDSSWNELGRVYVSPDNINWYENSAVKYESHPNPGNPCSDYDWDAVQGLHGNTHTWANFRKNTQAETRDPASGSYIDLVDANDNAIYIPRYFDSETENMGGDVFDLTDFVHCETGEPWSSDCEMSYLKLVDDPSLLDGQDWNPDWMTGTRLMSAMGLNTKSVQ